MEYTITGYSPGKLKEKVAQYKELTAEKDDLMDRLQKVESEKSSVSVRIYQKVRSEYIDQLEVLMEQLTPVESELKDAKREFERELADLDEQIRLLEDELAEAEFRFRVGEHDDSTYTHLQTRINPDLADKSDRQTEINERLKVIGPDLFDSSPDAGDAAVSPKVPATDEDTAATEENVSDAESVAADDPKDSTTADDDGASRATLPSDDPLEALTEKRDDDTGDRDPAPEKSQTEKKDKKSEEKASAEDDAFENPQIWIDELGDSEQNDDDQALESDEASDPEPAEETSEDQSDVDPLSALADPSAEKPDQAAEESPLPEPAATATAFEPEETEEVCMGFPNLVIITGPSSGKKIPLLPMTMSIGREHDNNIELKDPDVGRYHARIMYEKSRFVLEDLESSNGTWLNGEKITQAGLKNGDRVKIGETEMAIDFD